MQDLLIEEGQELEIVSFQSQFWQTEIDSIFMKMILFLEYSIGNTTFGSILNSQLHPQRKLFSKILPNF